MCRNRVIILLYLLTGSQVKIGTSSSLLVRVPSHCETPQSMTRVQQQQQQNPECATTGMADMKDARAKRKRPRILPLLLLPPSSSTEMPLMTSLFPVVYPSRVVVGTHTHWGGSVGCFCWGAMSRIGFVKNFRATVVYKFIIFAKSGIRSECEECRDIILAICGLRSRRRRSSSMDPVPGTTNIFTVPIPGQAQSQSICQTTCDWNILICNYTSTTLLNGQLRRMNNRFLLHHPVDIIINRPEIRFLW